MKRSVRVLHYDGVDYTVVFEWTTNKKGNTSNVLQYLMQKLKENPPKEYTMRPPHIHDRLEIRDEDDHVYLYEYTSTLSVREI